MGKKLKANYILNQNITITEVRITDAQSIVNHINDREIYENTLTIPFPYTLKDAKIFVSICRKFEKMNHQICNYAIRYNEEMIGGIGLLFNHGVESHKSEFGYWIGKDYRNQGIMTMVIQKFIEICFEEKALFRLEANVFTNNLASSKTLLNAGFNYEGIHKSSFIKEDKLRDTNFYSIVKNYHEIL